MRSRTVSAIPQALLRCLALHGSFAFFILVNPPSTSVAQTGLQLQRSAVQESRSPAARAVAPRSQEIDKALDAFRTGDYEESTRIALSQVDQQLWSERWPILLIQNYLQTGKYEEALLTYERSLERFGDNLRLRLLGRDVYQRNNLPAKADEQLDFMEIAIQRTPWRYTTPSELIPLGKFFLLRGEDPKIVLEACFDQAIKLAPSDPEGHIATAEMALEKSDSKLASNALEKALALTPDSPKTHFLLAQAWSPSDSQKATEHLRKSLEINPRFTPSLLLATENKMNEEAYDDALALLDEIEKINPKLPALWAYRAAIAHLQGHYEDEGKHRAKALEAWELNPEVDFTIGKHLAMHYRFAEGVTYQRRALKMAPDYLPARTQLAQDLLRLGEMDEGWALVEKVRVQNPYDVTIFNLKQLERELQKFATLEAPGFIVRMDAREARIYGSDVIELLSEARSTLTKKYNVELVEPIYVEIFPKQKDFAIRTFGLPGGQGFLGVCFGRLITANSPAALQVDSNWKSVLWHEYCHVVTLQKTNNRMPRWLSEGISVYEEQLKDPSWGQAIDPTYRRMLLSDELHAVSNLSSAFLQAKSPLHLQFAYLESSIAVEFFIENYGMPAMLKLLDDLGTGMPINDAIRRAPGSLEALDSEFKTYAHRRAHAIAPNADWSQPDSSNRADQARWYQENPDAFVSVEQETRTLIRNESWEQALEKANRLKDWWPDDPRESGTFGLLAQIYRGLGNQDAERESLVQITTRASDAFAPLQRLIELDTPPKRFEDLFEWSQKLAAIQPIRLDVQTQLANSAEATENWHAAEKAWKASLDLAPLDEAWTHFKIAAALSKQNQNEEARQHTLMALEESPRFTDALQLLLQLQPLQADRETAESPLESTGAAPPPDQQPDNAAPKTEEPTVED